MATPASIDSATVYLVFIRLPSLLLPNKLGWDPSPCVAGLTVNPQMGVARAASGHAAAPPNSVIELATPHVEPPLPEAGPPHVQPAIEQPASPMDGPESF